MLEMSWQRRFSPLDDHELVVEVRGPAEWILLAPTFAHALHVFRLGPADRLVSEVGRDTEGRGADLKQAVVALSAHAPSTDWWGAVAEALEATDQPS
jgi:hypothetical protein